ncbi:MAG: penicillin-binding transpeptidase domain-containing protein [Oscillospiraceae bacterium]|nr:penicillin-binding transpeptidase domain-containing protein [Oscillospiraceae bacterium]
MDRKETQHTRLYLLAGFLAAVLLVYLGVLYDTQVNHYDDYLAKSIRSIAREEKVESSRGIITDRNGRPLVTNRSTYALTFDASLLKSGDDENEAILRLVQLCQDKGVIWNDNLPISRQAPFSYTVDQMTAIQKGRFLNYLLSLSDVKKALGEYLLEHPELLDTKEDEPSPAAGETEAKEQAPAETAADLAERLTTENLTTGLLNGAGISTARLLEIMRENLNIPASFTTEEARLVLGVQYELSLRKLPDNTYDAYILANDVDTTFISLLSDGSYKGAKVSRSSVREYATTYAAHILGTVGRIETQEEKSALGEGYGWDDMVGKSGVEAAFESYLKGTDGYRVVSSNAEGKVTGEYYSKAPVPGSTVELTIDLEFQQVVEDALAEVVSDMNAEDGNTARGAAAAVVKVGTGEVLSLASYPTYDLSTYRQPEVFQALNTNPAKPFYNRATSYPYAPGSTLKPLTAVAALESGATTLTEKINDTYTWYYPGDPQSYSKCWKYGGHGRLNVTQAITNSCNYFFSEMGYRMGMDTFREYLTSFGLGEHTGIEIGDNAGTLPENRTGENQAPWAAYGQANQEYTPLQLANYIATLVSGGKHCEAHLLKAVKSYDNADVLAVGDTSPVNTVDISDSTLNAVKKGMYDYTQPGGMVYSYFQDCVVSAGAKTGTAQLGGNKENNGVFVCFAPYEEPEIAVALVIEQGGAGAALASTAVTILNAYFSTDETGAAVIGENQLLQ